MKMLFQTGQDVTPVVSNEGWYNSFDFNSDTDIKFGKVYQVAGYDPEPYQGFLFIYLEGIPDKAFVQEAFAPVAPSSVIEEQLSEIFSLEVRK